MIKFFIDTIQNNLNINFSVYPSFKNASHSFLFIEDNHIIICPKLKLGQGDFSKVFFGIDKLTYMEIAIKTPKTKNKIIEYQNEGKVIKSLEGEFFFIQF